MKKKLLSLGFVTLAGAAMAVVMAPKPVMAPADAAHAEKVIVVDETNWFNNTGGVWGNNSLTEQGEAGSGHWKLTSIAGGGDNCWMGLSGKDDRHAGKYIFRAQVYLDADYASDNVGFGFWSTTKSQRINETVFYSQLKKGEWSNVEILYDWTEENAVGLDSIHMWVVNGGSDTYIEIKNMRFSSYKEGDLGENKIKDVGFENIDLSEGPKSGFTNHSGPISGNTRHLWTSEGTAGEADYNQFLHLSYEQEGDAAYVDFCSMFNDYAGSWPAGIEAGEYLVELDIRKNAAFGTTNNVGFAFYSRNEARIERDLTAQVNAAPVDTWTTVSFRYPNEGVELTQNYADGVDSFQFWANTNSNVGAVIDIDNVEVRKITVSDDKRPEFKGGVYAFDYVEADLKDVEIEVVDFHGYTDFTLSQDAYELALNEDYTFDNVANKIAIKKEFLNTYEDGTYTFGITTDGGTREFTIGVTHIQEPLPDPADYTLERTVFGGDFADLDVGYVMSEEQTKYAWGSVSLDNPGVIVEEQDGSKALKIAKGTNSYSSAFVMLDPAKIMVDTIVTLEFDFKYNGTASDPAVDVCWVGSSNTSFHLIKLNGSNPAKTAEPQAKFREWDVAYTQLQNGYTHVKTSFRVDSACATSTNSMRFLMKNTAQADQEMRIQNVELYRWQKNLGTIDPTSGTFNKGTAAGLNITANLIDGASIDSIAVDTEVNYLEEETDYTVSAQGVINVKQAALDKLSLGEHKLLITLTDGNGEYVTLEYTLTVANAPAPAKSGCGGSIIATSILLSTLALAGAALVIGKKRKED